jgi:hypothetical protein
MVEFSHKEVMDMPTVKARKHGNALVLTVPASLQVVRDQEYFVLKNESGVISYIPKLENIYDEAHYDALELYQADEWPEETSLQVRELI